MHRHESRRSGKGGIIEIQQLISSFGKRRSVFVSQAKVDGKATGGLPIVLHKCGIVALAQIGERRSNRALRFDRITEQEIRERLTGAGGISGVGSELAGIG